MSSDARPTWPDLAPLLRGAALDRDAVWAVIERHAEFAYGAVRRVIAGARDVTARHDGNADLAAREALSWSIDKLYARVVKPPPGLPVSARRDGSPGDAAAWYRLVWSNLARDWCKAQRRQWRREEAIDDARPPASPEPDPWDDAALRGLQNLLARTERSGVSATHVLTYLALVKPDRLDARLVDLATTFIASAGSRSGAMGLARPSVETWTLLQRWRDTHDGATDTSRARITLAWILRSQDDGDPATWKGRAPADARTATVTVGKWAIRCADALQLPRA